jgi:L-serine dehydratase
MSISVFDIYKIGIGPSSSHTVGPMKASLLFVKKIFDLKMLQNIKTIKCDLYGSLALTGKGHGTDKAIILGLMGHAPDSIDSSLIPELLDNVKKSKTLKISIQGCDHKILFDEKEDLKFHRRISLPEHPNGMALAAFDNDNKEIFREVYFSVGGGFILTETETKIKDNIEQHKSLVPYPFKNAQELLKMCKDNSLSIPDLMRKNETTWRTAEQIEDDLQSIWLVMQNCVKRGFHSTGELPGGLKVKRRAPDIYKNLINNPEKNLSDVLSILDWVNLYALSVNEENAAGGQVVTAPTNGAAGIIPAVLHYYSRFSPHASAKGVNDFLLTAGAIAILYKINASISGAEVGCQGEVGVACSMAAGALTQVMGGSIDQVENAAEIAMEHNLGLTCDPIGGLVQIPCIERNAMGAIKAINATRMALRGDGTHFVSLDKVIKTMKKTGQDMKKQYKETSRGGLAVNIPEC